ncbi:MAG TPA: glutaminase A [Jiangellaceae bacterium]|nr:glutaminase A [Jiangellaceae bacterium]
MRTIVQDYLDSVLAEISPHDDGEVAGYIPELAKANPDSFGICVATPDGHVYESGDTRVPFAIQSISKPFTYGLAITDLGFDAVSTKIDVEPSGEPFNEVSLDPVTKLPRNAMINAGAIAAASLVRGADRDERFARIQQCYSACAGRPLELDNSIYRSESETGHRNRAVGHLLRSFGVLDGDPEEALDVYLKQCSVIVECRDLAIMAATLANGGTNPITGVQALPPAAVQQVLSVMTTCGMYDNAGDWVTTVGLPAKSGVGGGILAVLPGQLSVAVFSPRLDQHGNSVRGDLACRRLSKDMELHFLNVTRGARSAVRAQYDVTEREGAPRIRIFELHGDLHFAGAESVVRAISEHAHEFDGLVLEVSKVDQVGGVARSMLLQLQAALREDGKSAVIVDPDGELPPAPLGPRRAKVFTDLDSAVAWCTARLEKPDQ